MNSTVICWYYSMAVINKGNQSVENTIFVLFKIVGFYTLIHFNEM